MKNLMGQIYGQGLPQQGFQQQMQPNFQMPDMMGFNPMMQPPQLDPYGQQQGGLKAALGMGRRMF